MKNIIMILLLGLFISCGNTTEDNTPNTQTPYTKPKATKNNTDKGTYLCKINGEDWAYTKASGIISTYGKPKKRTALITFKKKLEKGSESIQLEYDANSLELLKASVQLKFEQKSGKMSTCYYNTDAGAKNRHPQQKISGSIDLSDTSAASGDARVDNVNIWYKKNELQDAKNGVITISDLSFTGIGYSDTDKLLKK